MDKVEALVGALVLCHSIEHGAGSRVENGEREASKYLPSRSRRAMQPIFHFRLRFLTHYEQLLSTRKSRPRIFGASKDIALELRGI